MREERRRKEEEEMGLLNAAMEVWNKDQDFVEKKLNEFRIQYDPSDRDLVVPTKVEAELEQKMQLKNEIDELSSSDNFDEIKHFDSKVLVLKDDDDDDDVSSKEFEIKFKKLNLVEMGKEFDQSDDHIVVEALTAGTGVEQSITGSGNENAAMDGFKKEERESNAVKKLMNVTREESIGFDDHHNLEFSGQLLGIEKNTLGLVGVNEECGHDFTSLAVEIEGFEEEEQVDDMNTMLNSQLRESDQSQSISDLEVPTRLKRNELTHEKEKFANKLKNEEEADEEKTNEIQRNTIQSDANLGVLKVISDRVAELEIDLSGLQVDVVCLLSEKEKAAIKLVNAKNGIGAVKVTNVVTKGELKKMNTAVGGEKREEEDEVNVNEKHRKIIQSDTKLEALNGISDQAAELEMDLSRLQTDLARLMLEIEKAVAKFQGLSSELEKLRRISFGKILKAVNLVRNVTEPTDHVVEQKIDSFIKRCSDQCIEKTNGERVKQLEVADPEKTHGGMDLRIKKMELVN